MPEQKHHYIPEFYLKEWTQKDGRLIEFCRRHANRVVPRVTFPGGTGYMRGLYTMPSAPPHIRDVLEKRYLSVADGYAAITLRKMLDEHWVPFGPYKVAWTRFVMSLLYRTPEGVARSMQMITKFYEDSQFSEEIRENYARMKSPGDPETPEEFVRQHGQRMSERTLVTHLMDIIESVRVKDKIMAMQWHLGHLKNQKHSLLTGDRPLVMTNGIAYERSHIVMPISPEHILIMTNSDSETRAIKALSESGDLTRRLNDRIVRQARKFVYSRDKSQVRFIEARLGERAHCSPFE